MKHISSIRRSRLVNTLAFSSLVLFQACGGGGGGEGASSEYAAPAVDQTVVAEVSQSVGASVDDFKGSNQLLKTRDLVNEDSVDQCTMEKTGTSMDKFADQISHHVSSMLEPTPVSVGGIGALYGAPVSDEDYDPSSLMSHRLCEVTPASLKKTLKQVPSAATIEKMNKFTQQMNELRERAQLGDVNAKAELQKKWTKVFSCLSYSESLNTSDTATSRSVSGRYAPADYEKPPGVKFYEDKLQPLVSRLNIGMYQFTPNSAGNVRTCLKAWNAMNSQSTSCKVSQSGNRADLIKILGSSQQSFNAFCGVHKVVETFAIQAYTKNASATHPSNKTSSGLKAPADRCVTPYFYAGWAYNHFGPLQNSTGSNLKELHQCIEGA